MAGNPPEILEQLWNKIVSDGNKIAAGDLLPVSITRLFNPLFGTETIDLENPLHGYPENTLSITAKTKLIFTEGNAAPLLNETLNFRFYANENGTAIARFELFTNPEEYKYKPEKLSLKQLGQYALLPPSMAFTPEQWPEDAELGDIQFVFDSDARSLSVLNGVGSEWKFLGYSAIFLKDPKLVVVKTVDVQSDFCDFTANASAHISNGGKLHAPIIIGLPVGLLGWTVSAPEKISLKESIGILAALVKLDENVFEKLLPDAFAALIKSINLSGLFIRFNPFDGLQGIYSVSLSISQDVETPWEIWENKLSLSDLLINLSANKYTKEESLAINGQISGNLDLRYDDDPAHKISIFCSVPFPAFSGNSWQVAIDSNAQKVKLSDLVKAVEHISEINITSILPEGFYDALVKGVLNDIILDEFSINFKYEGGFKIERVVFSVHSEASWALPMLQEKLELSNIKLKIDYDASASENKIAGLIAGTIEIDDWMISVPISLSKEHGVGNNWELNVNSDYIPLPSLKTLTPFMGTNLLTSSLPPGLFELGEFALYNIELKWEFGGIGLRLFSFTVQSKEGTPAWNLVPGYFELTQLFATLSIENKSVATKDISGSICCALRIVIADHPDDDLYIGLLAEKKSTNNPWRFAGSLQQAVALRTLLIKGLHLDFLEGIIPDLTVSELEIAIEPNSGSFAIHTTIDAGAGWEIFPLPKIELLQLKFGAEKNPDGIEVLAEGSFKLIDGVDALVTAKYINKKAEDEKGWEFSGEVKNAEQLSLKEVLRKYVPSITAFPGDMTITSATVHVLNYNTKQQYDFSLTGDISFSNGTIEAELHAIVNVVYDSKKPAPYSGTNIKGILDFGGLEISALAEYKDNGLNHYTFDFKIGDIGFTVGFENNIIVFEFNGSTTLGDIINMIAEAAIGEKADIPSPWDFITNISLSDFKLKFGIENRKPAYIELSYASNLNLGFIEVNEISLRYTVSDKSIVFKVTEGTFLGQNINSLPQEKKPDWDLRDPGKAPKVPGLGSAFFELDHLGLGNQVMVKGNTPSFDSVNSTLDYLITAFDPPQDNKLPTTLETNADYGWLIGARFKLLGYIDVGLLFYDPVIYGLHIGVSGGKLKGLDFQILYKKVNSNIGVYQLDLTLPDVVRRQQLGAVSITLPVISIQIYTNGDFKLDMGFPYNGDFSRSFALEVSIFTGAGGFYFAKLSNATAGGFGLPATSKGEFNPVIAIGIGIKAGIGRSIDKGILKAELSLTMQAIMEGVFATYHPYAASQVDDEKLFYRIQAQLSLVGRIYGKIDFAIISASVEIMASIVIKAVVEAYKDIELMFNASVTATASITIDFGLFDITISFSFSTSVSENFTITNPDGHNAPWLEMHAEPKSKFFYALDRQRTVLIPEMKWSQALVGFTKESVIDFWFYPNISLRYHDAKLNKREPIAVALFAIKATAMTADASATESDFTRMAKAFLVWVLNAYFHNGSNILTQKVSIENLQEIYDYFNQEKFSAGEEEPFSAAELLNYFFNNCFEGVKITSCKEDTVSLSGGVVPVIPVLDLEIPNGENPPGRTTINFETHNLYTAEELKKIKEYFREMMAQFEDRNEGFGAEKEKLSSTERSLAQYVFVDYFAMMAKYSIGAAMDTLKQLQQSIPPTKSLADFVNEHAHYGKSIEELAYANRHKTLNTDATILIPELNYRLRKDETDCETLIKRYPHIPAAAWKKAYELKSENANTLKIPSFALSKTDGVQYTLRDLAERFDTTVEECIRANANTPGLFSEGTRLLVPMLEEMQVDALVAKLIENRAFDNLAGMLSRFFLSGLRIPAKGETTGERLSLFEATGQTFAVDSFVAEDAITLKINTQNKSNPNLQWLRFEDNVAKETTYTFNQDNINSIQQLSESTLLPGLTMVPQADVLRYKKAPKTFTLPEQVTWQNPDASTQSPNCYIWNFSGKLQQLLYNQSGLNSILKYQSTNSPFSMQPPVEYEPAFWCTRVEMKIARLPLAGNEAFVYNVIGCSAKDSSILSLLLAAESFEATALYILFNKDKAEEGVTKPVTGLTSAKQSEYKTYLLQTNFSNESNPPLQSVQEFFPENLVGMSIHQFLTNLWECSIVRSGGYYLYYKNSAEGKGLPENIFDQSGNANLTLLVSYSIPAQTGTANEKYYALPAYVNSVMITKDLKPGEDNLFVEPYLNNNQPDEYNPVLQNKTANLLPGNAVFKAYKINPDTLHPSDPTGKINKYLEQLFSLVEYSVRAETGVYKASNRSLPLAPTESDGLSDYSMNDRFEKLTQGANWSYQNVVPLFPFVESATSITPYSSNSKTAKILFNLLDVFGNTLEKEDGGRVSQDITPGYMDAVIGIDQWPAISSNYFIKKNQNEFASFTVNLVFDAGSYVIEKNEGGAIVKTIDADKAKRDLKLYDRINWQLERDDVKVYVSNTLDKSATEATTELRAFLTKIRGVLEKLSKKETQQNVSSVLNFLINEAGINEAVIFALKVQLEIKRTEQSQIDYQFLDVPEVKFSSSPVPPAFYGNKQMHTFAEDLEKCLPFIKVALGESDVVTTQTSTLKDSLDLGLTDNANTKEVWLTRWQYAKDDKAFNGIKIDAPLSYYYFSVRPLSTQLISRPDETHPNEVTMRKYKTGEYIGKEDAETYKSIFTNVDIETLSSRFLNAVDTFFSSEMSTLAWQLQTANGQCNQSIDPLTCPFNVVEQSKRNLARTIAGKQLTTVLQYEGVPPEISEAAKKSLEQRLLIQLSNIYTINSLVQTQVAITQGNSAAALYGNLEVSSSNAENNDSYVFSPSRLSLSESESPFSSFLTFRNSATDTVDRSVFEAELNLHLTSIEHNYKDAINGYVASSWLTLIHPVILAGRTPEKPFIEAAIPLPLKVYPTAPSMKAQWGYGTADKSKESYTEKLENAKLWNYDFEYEYIAAVQDTIYTQILFNSTKGLEGPEEEDLFSVLSQFNAVYERILDDIRKNDNNSLAALQSFAWLTQRVATAWNTWNFIGKYENPDSSLNEINFTIKEDKFAIGGEELFEIKIETIRQYPFQQYPLVVIDGFETYKTEKPGVYRFYKKENNKDVYLPFADRKLFPKRKIRIERCDLLDYENAWAGVSIHRNEELAEGYKTNEAFIYKTPYIRFKNACAPTLINDELIDVAAFSPAGKQTLKVFLSNFFNEFFNEKTDPQNIIQIECSYSYTLQSSGAIDFVNLNPNIPILLTIPAKYTTPLLTNVESSISKWIDDFNPQGLLENGCIRIILSVFSSLSDVKAQTPILRLTGLKINTSLIDFD